MKYKKFAATGIMAVAATGIGLAVAGGPALLDSAMTYFGGQP